METVQDIFDSKAGNRTMTDIVLASKLTYRTVAAILYGHERRPRIQSLAKLAKVLGVPLKRLRAAADATYEQART